MPLGSRTGSDDVTAVHEGWINDSEAASAEPIALDDVPDGTPGMFVVRQGPKRGSRIHLDSDQITIGRHPESDIFLDDVTVSRRHAEVRRGGGVFEGGPAGRG
ncbi:MAG: FHA domain-containing protein, partial [Actinomycetota bacterium]